MTVREFTVIVSPRNFVVNALNNNLHSGKDVNQSVVVVGPGTFTTWGQDDIILSEVPETFEDLP